MNRMPRSACDVDGLVNGADVFPLDFNYQDGDLDNSSSLDAADILIVTRIALGTLEATLEHILHGDVAPLGALDGEINAADVAMVMRLTMQAAP